MKYLNLFVFILILVLCLDARERRQEEPFLPTTISVVEIGEPEVEYTVLSKSRELQRQGLLAFHLQEYVEAESCYSLAMKAAPKSKDILVEYTFCSLLVPVLSPAYSVNRAKKLLVHMEELSPEKMPRYWVAKALLSRVEGDVLLTLQYLDKAYALGASKTVKTMMEKVRLNESFDAEILKQLLPIRMAPREKRSQRR